MTVKILTTLSLFLAFASVAHANVIFNNFGVGDSFNAGAWEFRGENNVFRIDRAKSFIPAQNYNLTSVEVALYNEVGDRNFDTLVCTDSGGAPGAVLGSFTQTAAPGFTSAIYTAPYAGIALNSGTTYWVILAATSPGTSDGGFWWGSSPTPPGDTGFSSFNFPTPSAWTSESGSPAPVLRVNGSLASSAPEPASLALLCLGMITLVRKGILRSYRE